jgi:hypothetical protein
MASSQDRPPDLRIGLRLDPDLFAKVTRILARFCLHGLLQQLDLP